MRQISSAAVITDACNIEKEIIGLKIAQTGSVWRVSAPVTS